MLQEIAPSATLFAASVLLVLFGDAQETALPGEIEQQPPTWEEVRGVVESRCLECHGGKELKGGLRFIDASTFRAGGDRGPVVDADELAASRLLHAISYEDPELSMPPTGKLDDAEIALLVRWVLAGALWPEGSSGTLVEVPHSEKAPAPRALERDDWWAYLPLTRPEVPVSSDVVWNVHPIDAFVKSRLERAGLEPASLAGPTTLLRRASFDLTGLPPTPEELEAFLQDIEEFGFGEAWHELVERLLASPHYGERWGRHWLDLVRYAETNGYERDGTKKNIWRYRDWVIRSLNADKPYDRFVLEQLAGDELVDGDGELTAEETDALLATGYFRLGVWDDEPADKEQALADELADIVDTTGQIFLGTTVGCARCHDHKADPILQNDYYSLTAFFNNLTSYGGGDFGQHLGAGMTRALGDAPGPYVLSPAEREEQVEEVELELAAVALALGVTQPREEDEESAILVADARAETGAALWRYHLGEAPEFWHSTAFDASAWSRGRGGFGRSNTPGAILGTDWTEAQIHLRTRFRLETLPRTAVLSLHHDEDTLVFLNGQPIAERSGHRTDYTEIQLGDEARSAFVVGSNVLAVVCLQTGGGQYIDAGLRTGKAVNEDVDWLERLERSIGAAPTSPDARRARELLDRRARILALPQTLPYAALVASERGSTPAPQHVLLRGSVHAPGKEVAPDIPAAFKHGESEPHDLLPEPGEKTSGRRLALARWMVGEGSFLTARVMANRLWQFHFGRGLCRSPGDFGRLGFEPTHPELLDHLAVELIERRWSLKAMHRYLMDSRAYRMASVGNRVAREADPRNDLYWRHDPRRLTAEEYRDGVLRTNGTLTTDLFGPSVYPPMEAEVLATASRPNQAWGRSSALDAARRSIYVFVKRSLRLPLFETLDQPDPDLPCPARFQTNVPTQALVTLNGDFCQDAADRFAERLRRERADLGGQIRRGLVLALGRVPDSREVARNVAFVGELRREHDLGEEAALRLFCLGLYNRNEFLWVD